MAGIFVPSGRLNEGVGKDLGKQFRLNSPNTLATANDVITLKFAATSDFRLTDQVLHCHNGEIKLEVYVAATEATAFTTPVTSFGKNRRPTRPQPYYVSAVSINSGGTFTGGNIAESLRIKVANATGQTGTIQSSLQGFRDLPAGNYFLKFTALSNDTQFTYILDWEEL